VWSDTAGQAIEYIVQDLALMHHDLHVLFPDDTRAGRSSHSSQRYSGTVAAAAPGIAADAYGSADSARSRPGEFRTRMDRQFAPVTPGSAVSAPGSGSGAGSAGAGAGGPHSVSGSVSGSGRALGQPSMAARSERSVRSMFAKKTEVYSTSEMSRNAILTSAIRMTLKAYFECVRMQTFGPNGLHQIQVDTLFMRHPLTSLVEDSACARSVCVERGRG
jgi:hypothetical protein